MTLARELDALAAALTTGPLVDAHERVKAVALLARASAALDHGNGGANVKTEEPTTARPVREPMPIPPPPSGTLWKSDRAQWKAEHATWQAGVEAAAATWEVTSIVSLIGQLASYLGRQAR